MKVTIPPLPILPHKESDNFTELVTANMPVIKQRWGSIITAACSAYGTDPNIILGFVATESPDLNPAAVSSAGAIGILQQQPFTAWDFLTRQAPQMTPGYALIIQRFLPGLLKPGGFTGLYSTWKNKLTSALQDPEFNLWTGITGISQLLWADIKGNNGNLRLDHVIIKYNAGGDDFSGNYHKYVVVPKLQNADPETLLNKFPLVETRAYLIKMLGIDGAIVIALRMA